MAKYEPRLSAPSSTNKNFIHSSYGGYNNCILISGKSCLPNCVGYAWGRWRELLGKTPKLSLNNAENWWGYTADGYKRGQTPKLGAVICWRKGQAGVSSDGAGHVAIVEQIKTNGDIVVSESHYGGTRWRTYIYTKSSNYRLGSAYTFHGFIYLPITFEEEKKATSTTTTSKKKSNTVIAKEVLAGKWGNGNDRKKKLETAGYNYTAIQKEVDKLLSANSITPSKPAYTTGDYKVTADVLNVRDGAGTQYPYRKFNELSKNAQNQILEIRGTKVNGYVKGMECTISKIKDNWGKTPSGWICLDYCEKIK